MTIEQWLAVFAAGHRDAHGAYAEPWASAEDALAVCGVVLLAVAVLVVLLVFGGSA